VILVKFGVSVYWANAAGFGVGSIANVLLIREFVFKDSRFRLVTDLQLSFASNALIFGLGMSMLWLFIEVEQMGPYSAKLLTNGVTFGINYAIRVVFFRKK
jgi:putative flippase GtrA